MHRCPLARRAHDIRQHRDRGERRRNDEFPLLERLGERYLAWQKAIRFGFQQLAELKLQRERDLLTLSAEELYRKLGADSPVLAGRVPQKDLAAFLGVTPVGINRIVRRTALQASS